jgi:hypothetical protein
MDYKCDQCGRNLPDLTCLRHHCDKKLCKIFECDQCCKTFKSLKGLIYHLGAKHQDFLFQHCDFCSLEFYTKLFKKNHFKKHHNFTCDLCGRKGFFSKSKYYDHRSFCCGILTPEVSSDEEDDSDEKNYV